jgi:hypothetical protein
MSDATLLPDELRVFAGGSLFVLLAWVVRLVRRQELGLRESLLWLISTSSALVIVVFPRVLASAARLLHVQVPANALFAVGFLYVLINLLSTTIAVARNASRARRLSQECAMLRAELEQLQRASRKWREP